MEDCSLSIYHLSFRVINYEYFVNYLFNSQIHEAFALHFGFDYQKVPYQKK